MKLGTMRWAVHLAHGGDMRDAYKVLVVMSDGRDYLKDLDVDGMIILKSVL
jgi:hypothetical protein